MGGQRHRERARSWGQFHLNSSEILLSSEFLHREWKLIPALPGNVDGINCSWVSVSMQGDGLHYCAVVCCRLRLNAESPLTRLFYKVLQTSGFQTLSLGPPFQHWEHATCTWASVHHVYRHKHCSDTNCSHPPCWWRELYRFKLIFLSVFLCCILKWTFPFCLVVRSPICFVWLSLSQYISISAIWIHLAAYHMACIINATIGLQHGGITGLIGICHRKQRIAKRYMFSI